MITKDDLTIKNLVLVLAFVVGSVLLHPALVALCWLALRVVAG